MMGSVVGVYTNRINVYRIYVLYLVLSTIDMYALAIYKLEHWV